MSSACMPYVSHMSRTRSTCACACNCSSVHAGKTVAATVFSASMSCSVLQCQPLGQMQARRRQQIHTLLWPCCSSLLAELQKQLSKSLAALSAAINALDITQLCSYLWLHKHMYTFMYLVLSAVINMYACMGCLYDGPTMLASTLIGLEISPLFNKPFLAESFSSFWGRRWNLCVGNSVRVLIYDPIQEGTVRSTCATGAASVADAGTSACSSCHCHSKACRMAQHLCPQCRVC